MYEQNTDDSKVNDIPEIKTTKVVYPQVYSYTLLSILTNDNYRKTAHVGVYCTNKNALEGQA